MGMFGSMGRSLFGAGPAPVTPEALDYKPGALDVGLQMLFGGQSPADAAEHLREVHYANASRPMQMQALQRWLGMFGGSAPQQPAAEPAPQDQPPQTLQEMMGQGIGRAIGTLPPPAPARPDQPQPAASSFDISDPRTQQMLFGGAAFGLPGAQQALEIAKLSKPEYVNGVRVNPLSGKAPGFIPAFDKGQEPLYDANGRIVGIRNMDGSVQAAADMAGAVSGAQEAGKAPWTLVDVPQSDGTTRKIPLSIAAPLLARGVASHGAAAAPSPPGDQGSDAAAGTSGTGAQFGVTQSPAEQTLANKRAETQAQREQLQPKELGAIRDLDNASDLTVNTIHQILGDVKDPQTGQWKTGGKSMIHPWTTGVVGGALKNVLQPSHDLDELLEHVNAATSMANLQNLRDNSPTGAGLGRVTQQEIGLLAAMNGSTDQRQSGPQFEQNLRRQLTQLEKAVANRRQVYQQTYGNVQQPAPIGQGAGRASAAKTSYSQAELQAEARRRGLIH